MWIAIYIVLLACLPRLSLAAVGFPSSGKLTSVQNITIQCNDSEVLKFSGGAWGCAADASGAGSGASLDLANDAALESLSLNAVAVTGDTNGIFTESAADKLLIDATKAWPTATAFVTNRVNCTAGLAAQGVSQTGAAEGCFAVASQTAFDARLLLDFGDDGADESTAIAEIATVGTNTVFSEPSANKLLITVSNPWPTATALAANGLNCAAGQSPLGIDADGAVEGCYDVATQVELDAVILAAGSSIILDLADNGVNESAGLGEIATLGDTANIFSESSTDKLLITVSNPWPTATALAANGANCTAGQAPLGTDAAGASESCFDVATQAEIDTLSDIVNTINSDLDTSLLLDLGDNTSNESTRIAEVATTGDVNSIFTEPAPDKLLIAVGNAWPTATALAANGANCTTGQAPLGVGATGAAENCFDVATQAELDATQAEVDALEGVVAAGGTVILDLADNGTNESTAIAEIATTGDASSIFTESEPNKLLITVSNPWPTATALAANGSNCAAGQAALGIDALGAVEGCYDVATQAELDAATSGSAATLDLGDNASFESLGLTAIATTGDTNNIFTESLPNKLLINVGLAWPTSSALAANGANCASGSSPLGVDAAGAVEGCFDVATQVELAALQTELDGTQGELDTAEASLAAHLATFSTSLLLDLADNGSNESNRIAEVAIVGDTHSVFTESAADKLLITVSNPWPTATALAANGANCSSGQAPLGVSAIGATESCFDVATQAELDARGSLVTLDLADNGTDESAGLLEVAVTGDTNSIFTEPAADKLLIAVGNAWPTATALAANAANCSSGEAPLGVSATGAVEGCYNVGTQTELDAVAASLTTHIANVFPCVLGICSPTDGQELDMSGISVSSVGEGLRLPGHATDCSTAGTEEGQVCWEADSDTLWIGTGAGVTNSTGGGGSGDIESVFGCASGACTSIALADGQLLDMSAVDSSSGTEGFILPQGASCSGASAIGQACWNTTDNRLHIGGSEGLVTFYPEADIDSIFSCQAGNCQGQIALDSGDGLDFSLSDPADVGGGLIFPTRTDCTISVPEGSACWDSDNDTLSVGTSTGVITFATGGSGDITSVFGCASGACTSVTVADTQLLDFGAVSVSSTTEGVILPGHATDCSTAGTAEGQVCWEQDSNSFWVGTGTAVVNISGTALTMDQVFANGREITTANSRANAFFVGDALGDGILHYTGTLGPTQECVTDFGGGSEATCDVIFNAAAGDSILFQQAAVTFLSVSNAGVLVDLPTGDSFTVDINAQVYQLVNESGVTFTLPAGDVFTVTSPSVIINGSTTTALQQAGATVFGLSSTGIVVDLPTGDAFTVDVNANVYQTVNESGVTFQLPAGDAFTMNAPTMVFANTAGTACLTIDPATGAITQGSNCTSVNFNEIVTSKVLHLAHTTVGSPVVLTGAQCRGAIHKNTAASTRDFTLCDGESGGGQMVCFEDYAGGIITVDVADTGETIRLSNGTSLTAGNAIDMAAGIGNGFCMLSDTATAWHVLPGAVGTITDGGAD